MFGSEQKRGESDSMVPKIIFLSLIFDSRLADMLFLNSIMKIPVIFFDAKLNITQVSEKLFAFFTSI